MQKQVFRRSVLTLVLGSIFAHASSGTAYAADRSGGGDDPCAQKTGQVAGAVIGALLGGLLGSQVGKGNGNKLAVAVGALGGLALGNYLGSEIDKRKCELHKIAQRNQLQMQMAEVRAAALQLEDEPPVAKDQTLGLLVSVADGSSRELTDSVGGEGEGNAALSSQFDTGANRLNPQAERAFRDIANSYATPYRADALPSGATQEQANAVAGLRQKRVLVVGHTDDTGNSRLNADLSEQRAQAVAKLFIEAGFPAEQVFYQGSGETQPIADNRSAEGRARNRRVDIVDLSDEASFQRYLASRRPNQQFYRAQVKDSPHESAAMSTIPAAAPVVLAGPEPAPKTRTSKAASPKPRVAPAPAAPAAPVVVAGPGFDFGGRPVTAGAAIINIGKPVVSRGWQLISSAMADDLPMARSCQEDHARVAHPVRSAATGRPYPTAEFMPNLYDTSWTDKVNGHLVALTHVAVLRDGAAPAHRPTLLVFRNADNLNAQSRPDYMVEPEVNTYQGEQGLLYRVFVNGPVGCMDIVIPRRDPSQAIGSSLYYSANGKRMVADFNPRIVKKS
ncbi:OmpA family protein [Massilia sp. TS11]|uniref:OmpA family protein n=1 Tax=Massilia sp. TS11 TaxID=2908003 RepID=UPI001EDAB8F9|nr:OmpA family protein [Massilia sp. TS11]MCG2586787.1 OmpA family protein [Massilia sp. TS11]